MLNISAGNASLEGILPRMSDIWRYDLECLLKSSKQIIESYPRSLSLSQIDIPIKGIRKLSKADEEECDAIISR
jgi:hypothetical protein